MNGETTLATEQRMLDGKAYKAHFPEDPAYDHANGDGIPRPHNYVALLEALAALEDEFRTILERNAASTD
jgi:hypothetical protein